MNFWSYFFGVNRNEETVAQDIDIAKHNKRYHKNGFNEHTQCKYRAFLDLGKVPITDKLYYDRIQQSIILKDAMTYLYSTNRVTCYHTQGGKELIDKFGFHPLNAEVYDTMGNPVSSEVFAENVCKFCAIVKDLNERIGKVPFDALFYLPFKVKGTYGASSLDKRRGTTFESFISVGGLSNAKLPDRIYHHNDERLPYDIIRHEIGHNLATEEVFQAWNKYRDSFGEGFREHISSVVNEYASTVADEGIAETFSKVTSPDYDGSLPEELEHIVGLMFGVKNLESIKMTTDEMPIKPRTPEGVNPLYFASFDFIDMDGTGIQWYDRAKGRYITFRSYDEKLEYGLQQYKLPKSLIMKLLEGRDRKWTAGDIQDIAMSYYTLGSSEDEIRKDFE